MEWRVWITWWILFCIRYSGIFEYKIRKPKTVTNNVLIKTSVNKIENIITLKKKQDIISNFYLLKKRNCLVGSSKSKITKDKNGKNMSHFEITEVLLIHCNIVNNDYQQDSTVLYTLVPNKSVSQLLDIWPKSWKNFEFSKTFDSKSSYIEVWLK